MIIMIMIGMYVLTKLCDDDLGVHSEWELLFRQLFPRCKENQSCTISWPAFRNFYCKISLVCWSLPMLTNVNDHPTKKEGGQMHNWTFETFIAAPEISFLCQCSLDPGWNWSLKQFFCGLWRILRRIFLVSSQGVLKLSEHYPHPNPEKRKSEEINPFSMQQCKQPLIKLLMAMLAMMMKLIIMMMELTMLMPLFMMVMMLTMMTIRSLAKRGQTSAPT